MKKFLTAIVAAMFLLMSHADAEIQTYTGEGTYAMSEGENLGVSKERAKADAMRNAAEKAGVYVRSFSRSINNELADDEIITMTSTILQLVGEPQFTHEPLDNLEGFLIRVTVTVTIDSNDVLRWLNKNSQERATLIAQNEALRKANADQERQIAELKRQLAAAKTIEAKEQITQKFEAEDKVFLSNQKVDEAAKFGERGDYNSAIQLCNEAIQLNPNNAVAYYHRGTLYGLLGQYERAIQEFNKSIQLDSNDATAYQLRGVAYGFLEQHERAIQDFDKAIQLNPDNAEGYVGRGITYRNLKQYERAIADSTKAIQLNPNYAEAYYNRGIAYRNLKQYERAIADFTKAIQLNPNDAYSYNSRGIAYMDDLKQYERAIADFDKAIQLNTNDADAYHNRGNAYYYLKQYERAIVDYTKAIQLDPNDAVEYYCRGWCWQAIGDNVRAQADFARARQLGWKG